MALFLLTFFLLYGGLHFYFFLKLRAAFAPGAAAQIILAALLVLGLIAPLIVRVSERFGIEILVRLMSWAGYIWMAILFFFSPWRFSSISTASWLMPPVLSSMPISARLFRRRGHSFSCHSSQR